MRSVIALSLLAAAALICGCQSTPRPQPLVRTAPPEKNREFATVDASSATGSVSQPVSETSSSTSLSSRWSKLFSRQDATDRVPLPRSDQVESGPGGNSAQQDLWRDF
jgi:hypothetical protein